VTKWDAGNIESAILPQGLQFGQLVYTSFPKIGFALLKSADVPEDVQHIFLTRLVQTAWDTYSPPKPHYRAVYLHQLTLATPGTLFGWLYHDGQDELRRSDVPYFMAYYFPNRLQAAQLSQVLACLQQGPIEWVNRLEHPPNELLSLSIENAQDYNAARQGVELPAKLRVESYRTLESQTSLNWFYADPALADQPTQIQESYSMVSLPAQSTQLVISRKSLGEPTMDINNLTVILQQLFGKPGIQGTALVSAEGQIIVAPIGIDENTAGILAGHMLCLLRSTQDEILWQEIETISVRSQEGHLILRSCGSDLYLLIKSDKVPIGLLEGEVSRAVEKLRTELETFSKTLESAPTLENRIEPSDSQPEMLLRSEPTVKKISEVPTLILSTPVETGVTYRGRHASP
jgi:predicted regulator of Ras-like GTPase activity (Roadblock/LC7/MglB family)